MRILVTGANGFTGVHFQKWPRRQATTLSRSRQPHIDELKKEVAEVEPEAVVHFGGLAAQVTLKSQSSTT